MFANVPTASAAEIGTWVLAATAVLGLAALAIKVFQRKPSIEAEFVTKAEMEKHVNHCAPRMATLEREYLRRQEFLEFKGEVREWMSVIDRKFEALSDKIDCLRSELSIMEERRTEAVYNRINRIEAQVNRIDERTSHDA